MRILLALLLFPSIALAQEYDHLKSVRGTLNMGQAYQWGQMQNQLAAEAPPIRYQIETINKNPAPSYDLGSASPQGTSLDNIIKGLKASEGAKEIDSPFNDSFMPGLNN